MQTGEVCEGRGSGGGGTGSLREEDHRTAQSPERQESTQVCQEEGEKIFRNFLNVCLLVFCLAGYPQESQEEAGGDAKGVAGTEESPAILETPIFVLSYVRELCQVSAHAQFAHTKGA